uniref:Uncharacterized protein n=1 Tax=Anguilla anguilla TaxID=7936 RepID=A0A0E9PSE2_ANGAN
MKTNYLEYGPTCEYQPKCEAIIFISTLAPPSESGVKTLLFVKQNFILRIVSVIVHL